MDQKISHSRFSKLKLELSAILISNPVESPILFYVEQLAIVFDEQYSIQEVEAAMISLKELIEKVEEVKLMKNYEEEILTVFPEQHFEGL